MDSSLIFSIISLLVSICVGLSQIYYTKRQDELNQLLVAKEKDELKKEQCANVSANLIKIGVEKHKIKVLNQGKSIASNVNFTMFDTDWVVITDHFPLEYLEPQQSVEIYVFIPPNSKSTQKCEITWEDKSGKHEKETIITA